jgi:hypothetical protein
MSEDKNVKKRSWLARHLFCASCGILRLFPEQCWRCNKLICQVCADPFGPYLHSPGKGLCPECRNEPVEHIIPPEGFKSAVVYPGEL